MSNPWYTRVFNAVAGHKVRSAALRAELDLIVAGFDGVSTKFLGALKLPASPAPSDQVLPAAALRANKVLGFDAAGDVVMMSGLASAFGGIAGSTVELLKGDPIASASTINLNNATGNLVHVTGTNQIDAVTLTRGPRVVIFDGVLTLAHHATNNNLPGGANITTAAGDRAIYWGNGTSVYCIEYVKASGRANVETAAATQAQMEAASSNTVMATPGTMNWHPGVAKAWVKCDIAGAIQASHNITSVTDDAVGRVTVTIANDLSSADYVVAPGVLRGGTGRTFPAVVAQAAGSFQMENTEGGTSSLVDPTSWFAVCFGDQP